MKVLTAFLFYIVCLFVVIVDAINWEPPNTWRLTKQNIQNDQSGNNIGRNEVSTILYKKLINYIMNAEKMKKNPVDGNLYRTLQLKITEEQMAQFKQLTDIRDIDSLISDILLKSNLENMELLNNFFATWTDTLLHYGKDLIQSNHLRRILLASICALAFYFHRMLIFSLVPTSIAIFYLYYFVDSECQRKKEVSRIANLLNSQIDNPCDLKSYTFYNYWFSTPSAMCKEYLLETTYSDDNCSIIDVWNEFIDLFFYQHLFKFFNFFAESMLKISRQNGIIILAVLLIIGCFLGREFIRVFFKYVLYPVLFRSTSNNNNQTQNTGSIGNSEKLLEITTNLSTALVAMTNTKQKDKNDEQQQQQQQALPPSRVEAIIEPNDTFLLKTPNENDDITLNESESTKQEIKKKKKTNMT